MMRVLAVLVWLMAGGGYALAQRVGGAEPGSFDYYVLSLSWSPSFCAARGENARGMQCAGDRAYSFVVHGLWPQYERGFPEYCQVPAPALDRGTIGAMLDLMPAPGLVRHEWEKHGTCSGKTARAYFETIRQARAAVKIPAEFADFSAYKTVAPGDVIAAFTRANPGLTPEMMAVDCDSRYLREVRVCMGKDMRFRACEAVTKRSCRRDQLVMPPVRASGGGRI